MTVEQNMLLHRHIALQGVVEDVRNRMARLETMLEMLVSQSKEFLSNKNQQQVDSGFKQLPRASIESSEVRLKIPTREKNHE